MKRSIGCGKLNNGMNEALMLSVSSIVSVLVCLRVRGREDEHLH